PSRPCLPGGRGDLRLGFVAAGPMVVWSRYPPNQDPVALSPDTSETAEEREGARDGDDVAPLARAAGARGDLTVVRDLLPYLRPYIGRITLALLLVILAKLANLVVPFVLKEIVDQLN